MTSTIFKKNLKAFQVFILGFPLISKLLDHQSSIPFPPMGDDTSSWRFIAFIVIAVSAFLPYFLLPKRRTGLVIAVVFALLVLSGVTYLVCRDKYVISIPRPNSPKIYVIRGSIRNPDLRKEYELMNDRDAIEQAGQTDEALEKVYTKVSLHANRWKLFASYLLTLMFLELFAGSFAKED